MTISTILISVALLVLVIPIVVNPLLGRGSLPTLFGKSNPRSARDTKKATLRAIQDLDFDYELGKIGDEDYRNARTELLGQAAAAIETANIDVDDRLEELIRERRVVHSQSISKTCSNCEETVNDSDHFCPHCGAQLAASCPACGEEFAKEDTFCSSCGVPLKEQQPD